MAKSCAIGAWFCGVFCSMLYLYKDRAGCRILWMCTLPSQIYSNLQTNQFFYAYGQNKIFKVSKVWQKILEQKSDWRKRIISYKKARYNALFFKLTWVAEIIVANSQERELQVKFCACTKNFACCAIVHQILHPNKRLQHKKTARCGCF